MSYPDKMCATCGRRFKWDTGYITRGKYACSAKCCKPIEEAWEAENGIQRPLAL